MSGSSNFYSGLMEWDSVKIVYVIWHILVTLIAPCLLYSFVWYEGNSADFRYRTLINQILTHCCCIEITSCIFGRNLFLSFYIIGPLSDIWCDVVLLQHRFFYLSLIFEATIRQVIKFLYIFQWRHIVALNDDFSASFLTIYNLGTSSIFVFVSYFLGQCFPTSIMWNLKAWEPGDLNRIAFFLK